MDTPVVENDFTAIGNLKHALSWIGWMFRKRSGGFQMFMLPDLEDEFIIRASQRALKARNHSSELEIVMGKIEEAADGHHREISVYVAASKCPDGKPFAS